MNQVLTLALFVLFFIAFSIGLGVVKNRKFGTDDDVEVNGNDDDDDVSSRGPLLLLGSILLASLRRVSLSSSSDLP